MVPRLEMVWSEKQERRRTKGEVQQGPFLYIDQTKDVTCLCFADKHFCLLQVVYPIDRAPARLSLAFFCATGAMDFDTRRVKMTTHTNRNTAYFILFLRRGNNKTCRCNCAKVLSLR